MSLQDRAISPINETISTQPDAQNEQLDDSSVTTVQDEAQPCLASERSDVSSASLSTRTQTSIDHAPPSRQYDEGEDAEETVDIAEPGESHAFLPNQRSASTSTEHEEIKDKDRHTMLLSTWWVEIVSLVTAIAAWIAIAVTMSQYHKEQPAWEYAINLNTLIAILSTLLRACMVVVVEEGEIHVALHYLAQISGPTWNLDIDTKIAILDGLANPDTTRSEISPDCSTGNCSFPSYNGVTHSSVGLCKKCVNVTPWLAEARITRGLPWNGTLVNSTVNSLVLPNGYGIGGGVHNPVEIVQVFGSIWRDRITPMHDSLRAAFDDSFRNILESSILNITVITFTNNDCEPFFSKSGEHLQRCSHYGFETSNPFWESLNAVATACSFYPCIRDYHGSVRNTVFIEAVVNDLPTLQLREQERNSLPDFVHFHTPCLIDGQTYTIENISSVPRGKHNFTSNYVDNVNVSFPTQCAYGVYGEYAFNLVDFIIPFGGYWTDYKALACSLWYLKGLANKGNASLESIDANMQSIALAVTSEMRKQGTDWDNLENADSKEIYAKGTVLRTTVCTQFDWKWLSFPLALLALTTLLLSIMCGKMLFDRQEIPAWKSSLLPLLFTGNQLGTSIVAGDMDKIIADTDKVVVSLSHNGRGWEFIRESCQDTEKKSGQTADS